MFRYRGRHPLLLILFLLSISSGLTYAQTTRTGDLIKKRVSDTILGPRTLIVRGRFQANKVLRQLFPGKWYALDTNNHLISWICPSCKPAIYPDANDENNGPVRFPFHGGVATRLINVFSYSDSTGNQYKVMSFNHSDYDPDGFQVNRFAGGLLGMAKFVKIDGGWQLEIFQPAIAAYGSFSQAPIPHPLLIGKDQYAFMINHINGGPGGPFWQNNYLIAEIGNSYQPILTLVASGCDAVEGECAWACTYSVIPGEKRKFRDIHFVSKGRYWAVDTVGLPDELKGKVKGKNEGNFRITRVFTYSEKKGYLEKRPARVWFNVGHS